MNKDGSGSYNKNGDESKRQPGRGLGCHLARAIPGTTTDGRVLGCPRRREHLHHPVCRHQLKLQRCHQLQPRAANSRHATAAARRAAHIHFAFDPQARGGCSGECSEANCRNDVFPGGIAVRRLAAKLVVGGRRRRAGWAFTDREQGALGLDGVERILIEAHGHRVVPGVEHLQSTYFNHPAAPRGATKPFRPRRKCFGPTRLAHSQPYAPRALTVSRSSLDIFQQT